MGRDLPVKNFIFTYENQACQKLFALGFRKFSPETTLTGYVHTYALPMYTLYSISEREQNLVPLPDKIIVNGEQSKKVLVDCGYPQDRVFTGGALRYTYLGSEMPAKPGEKGSFDVLVAASVNINEAVELIEKCLEAFSGKPAFNLIIKMHPTLPFGKISKYFPVLPKNVIVSETPVQELLARSDLVMYTSSTVAIEAVALGVPVIHVKSDHIIDMNFFEDENAIPSFSEPGDIARAGEQILLRQENLPRDESERLVKQYFLPVDDAVISLFATPK
jgi:surface carbohydrate biosynthesis protein (TIGR04326 family)